MPIDVLYEETYPWKFQKPGVVAHNPNNRDPILLEYPVQQYATTMIRNFQIPLWNPYVLGGVPELATGIFGVFYPFNGVYYLLPTVWAINIDVMLHAFLAGFFTYLYVVAIGGGRFGGVVAGACFMFSGILTLYHALYPEYHAISWLPLAFLCAEKLVVEQRLRNAVLLGGVIAVQVLAGQMQYIFYNLLAISAYLIFRGAVVVYETGKAGSLTRPFWLATLGVGIGLALGAVQLIPTLELVPQSQRVFRAYHEMIPLGRSSWLSLLTAFSPKIFGSFPDRNWFGPGYPSTTMAYIGVVGFLLMVAAVLLRRDKHVFVLAGLGLMTWLVALGTPFVYLLYTFVPGFSGLRQVGRAIYIYALVASILAGLGAAVIAQGTRGSTDRLLKRLLIGAAGVWAVTVVGVLGVVLWRDRLLPVATEFFVEFAKGKGWTLVKSSAHYAERIGGMIQYELRYGAIFLAVAGTLLLVLVVWRAGWLRPKAFQGVLAAIVAVDLLWFPLAYEHVVDTAEYSLYAPSDSIAFLKRDPEKYRVLSLLSCGTGQAFHPNTLMPYGIETIQAYNSLLPGRFGQFVRSLEETKIVCGGEQHQNLFMLSRFRDDGMTQLLNVKYVATPPVAPILQDKHLRLVFDGEVRLYENLQFLPRAFFVPNASWADQDENILARLRRDDFEPRSLVVLKGGPGGQIDRRPSPEGGPAEVSLVDYQPSEVRVMVNAPTDGWVVLLDNYFPGWRASVDGSPARIYQANFTFRAVNVPSGRHQIEFSYRPLSFTVGTLVTGGALLGCAVMLWYDKRRGAIQC
nr:YfhO family protein [Nitrospirota bacterium]